MVVSENCGGFDENDNKILYIQFLQSQFWDKIFKTSSIVNIVICVLSEFIMVGLKVNEN